MPRVSVLMSVYNDERYLREAVDSILGQTVGDFEFIIVDDGSTDGSTEILHSLEDARIVLLRNDSNIGLTRSLNRGLQRARGEYIARQDADDVSLPQRLEKQVAFLDVHPEVGLVGSAVTYVDPHGRELGTQRVPIRNIRQALLDVEFCWWHSSTAFRTECLERVGSYRDEFRYAQDYDLWLRIAEVYELASLSEPLVRLRLRPESISVAKRSEQRAYVMLAVDLARRRASEQEWGLGAVHHGAEGAAATAPPRLTSEELGQIHLRAACLNYLLGSIADAKQALTQAIQSDPTLAHETDRLVLRIVSYGWSHATTPTSRTEALDFLGRVFANLPPAAASMLQAKRKAIARVYAMSAFESYELNRYGQVLREIPRAVIHDPALFKDMGVWSVFVRALAGTKDCGEHEPHRASA